MNDKERKRLKKIYADAADREIGSSTLERLSFHDLLLLLRHDEESRALIRSIVQQPAEEEDSADVQEAPEEIVDEPVEAPPPKPVIQTFWPIPAPPPAPPPPAPVDPLRRQLATQLALLQAVRADEELASQWLGTGQEDEGQQLVRLIARVSQWDTVVDLWDLLAVRCKQNKRAASPAEHQILAAALAAHNLRWTGRQAVFRHVEVGAAYDFRHHQRGTSTGDTVRAEWLPGLTNAGGELQKPPLVQT